MTFRTIRKVTDLKLEDGDGVVAMHVAETEYCIHLKQGSDQIVISSKAAALLCTWLRAAIHAEDDNDSVSMSKGTPDA